MKLIFNFISGRNFFNDYKTQKLQIYSKAPLKLINAIENSV